MVYFMPSKVLTVATGLLAALPNTAAAPNLNFDPGRIYFPDDLDEVRRATAFQQCQNDPNCKTGLFFAGIPGACSATRDLSNVSHRNRANVRTSTGGCNPFAGEVVWPLTGECVELLTQGPCPTGYWVKLNINDLEPQCDPRPCPKGQALMEREHCHSTMDDTICPMGQTLIINEYGTGECDCEPGKAYHRPTHACFKPYSQGPCPRGYMIKVLDAQGSGGAQCVPNPCLEENMVMMDTTCQAIAPSSSEFRGTGTCYSIDTQGPCSSGTLAIDTMLLEPVCLLETTTHSIFNLPNLRRCPNGEIRDSQGRCRTPFRLNSRGCQRGSLRDSQGRCRRDFSQFLERMPPITTSRPGATGALCPQGEVLLAGVCYRLHFGASSS